MMTRPAGLLLYRSKVSERMKDCMPAKRLQGNILEKQQDGDRVQFKLEFASGHKCGVIHDEYSTTEDRGTVWQRSCHRTILTNWIQEVKDFWSSLNGW